MPLWWVVGHEVTSQDSMGVHGGSRPLPPITDSRDRVGSSNHCRLSVGRGGRLWVCPSPCTSLRLQRTRSFCICQTDAGRGRAAGTLLRGLGAGCRQLPAAREMPPAVNVSNVTNEPSVHPQAGGEQAGGSRRGRGCWGTLTGLPGGGVPTLWGCCVLPAALCPRSAGTASQGSEGHPTGGGFPAFPRGW